MWICVAWMLAASSSVAETLKVSVVPNVYAQSIEALIPEAKAQGLDIQIVEFSDWTTPNLALRHKGFASIPDGGSVAIANDPINQGRGLLLLQKAGLIKLKEGVGFQGALDDIVENPKHLKFSEVEGPQLVRVTPDVDLAMGYPTSSPSRRPSIPAPGFFTRGSTTNNSRSDLSSRKGGWTTPR